MRLGHAVLDALNDQGPEAQIAHLRAHLSQHPGDISVQLRLAHEHEELGDKAEEIALLSKLVFGAQGAEQVQSVDRLLDLNGLSSVTPVRRRQLADQLETSQAIKVLMTIVDGDKNDPQRPEAMLDLAGRLQGSEAEDIARRLAEEYPLHATTEVARQKGWLV
jgi:hypothetical protein